MKRCMGWGAALVAGLMLAGCAGDAPEAQPPQARAAHAQPAAIAAVPTDALRTRATEAMAAQRYFAPAGESAAELLLALRERGRATSGDTAALVELQPYLVIAVEQAIERREPDEAQRLLDLLAKIDTRAPALPRLHAAVEGARAAVAAARLAPAQAEDVAQAAEASEGQARIAGAAAPRAPRIEVQRVAAPSATTAAGKPMPVAAASPAAVVTRVAEQPSVAVPARPAAPEPVADAPARAALRLVQDATPRYPARALDRRIDGRVELMFTVQPDGSVSDLRVVDAQPAGVFDQAALQAARRWRFAPVATATTTSRALRFTPPQG